MSGTPTEAVPTTALTLSAPELPPTPGWWLVRKIASTVSTRLATTGSASGVEELTGRQQCSKVAAARG